MNERILEAGVEARELLVIGRAVKAGRIGMIEEPIDIAAEVEVLADTKKLYGCGEGDG